MENNNEVMDFEVIEMEPETEASTDGNMGTVVAMAIGAAITAGTIAGVKKVKKLWANHKAKKAVEAPEAPEVTEETKAEVEPEESAEK